MTPISRRHFARCAAAAALVAATPARGAQGDSRMHIIDMGNAPFLDRDRALPGLDSAEGCRQPNHLFLEALGNAGVDTVIRYYSDENNANLHCKNVTRRERDVLGEHGLALAIVYQFEGRRKGRYTGAQASQDAAFCLERARVIGQPQGSSIFFGVDADAALNTDRGVRDYFSEVRRLFAGRFRIGIYAAGARCRLIRDAGLADLFWVPEAPAWAGTRDFMNSGDWTMFQNKTDIDKSWLTGGMGQTLHIDTDIVNPDRATSIGAFRRDGSEVTYSRNRLRAVVKARHWVIDGKLDVFDEPDGAATSHLCIARSVHVLGFDGDWAWIDTDEDGIANGYCRRAGLAPLNQMPRWRRAGCKPVDI